MTSAFSQPDEAGRSSVQVRQGGGALLFSTGLHVNTDGTRRSYAVDDPLGERRALNNLCNAMRDACRGLTSAQRRARMDLIRSAAEQGWPGDTFRRSRLSRQIVAMRGARPCPTDDGYLPSATALHRPFITDPCDLTNYVDSLTVPALVLPGESAFAAHGAAMGDLVVAVGEDARTVVFGVVGDAGPRSEIGEASIAMNGALQGRTVAPATYSEIRGRVPGVPSWDVGMAHVLVFTGTRRTQDPYMTRAAIEPVAERLFERWGGIARLRRCIARPR